LLVSLACGFTCLPALDAKGVCTNGSAVKLLFSGVVLLSQYVFFYVLLVVDNIPYVTLHHNVSDVLSSTLSSPLHVNVFEYCSECASGLYVLDAEAVCANGYAVKLLLSFCF